MRIHRCVSRVHAGFQVGVRACALTQMCQRHCFLSFALLYAHEIAVQTTTQLGNCSPPPELNVIPAWHALLWSDRVPSFLVPSMSAAILVAELVPFGGWHHTNDHGCRFKRSLRFTNGIYWEASLFCRPPSRRGATDLITKPWLLAAQTGCTISTTSFN